MSGTVSVPTLFAAATSGTTVQLDADFAALVNALNNPLTYAIYAVDSGAVNAYAITLAPAPSAQASLLGVVIAFKTGNANTLASTLNVNGLGVQSIVTRSGAALSAGQIPANSVTAVVWDGTNYKLQSNINRSSSRQTFASGSGTYTTPTGVSYIKVKAVGGAGGGGGSCAFANNNGGTGGTGGDTTWASTLLVASGATGGGGTINAAAGSGGSTSSTAGPLILVSMPGSGGQAGGNSNLAVPMPGGTGGASPFGGAGRGGTSGGVAGGAAQTNSGSGGGGSGTGNNGVAGGGGGSGGYIEALIVAPAATYAYAVGAAGAAGAAGTGGFVGGAGGSGYIIVEEFYS